eukprot:tig00000870_g5128.t1
MLPSSSSQQDVRASTSSANWSTDNEHAAGFSSPDIYPRDREEPRAGGAGLLRQSLEKQQFLGSIKWLALSLVEERDSTDVRTASFATGRRNSTSGFAATLRSDLIEETILQAHRAEMSLQEENNLRSCLKQSEKLLRESVARGRLLYAANEDGKLQARLKDLEAQKMRAELDAALRANEDLSYSAMMSKKNESAMRALLEESERTFAENQREIAALRGEKEALARALRQAEDKCQVLQFKLEAVQRDYAELVVAGERGARAARRPHAPCARLARREASFGSTGAASAENAAEGDEEPARRDKKTVPLRSSSAPTLAQMAAERRLNAALEERLEAERLRWSSKREREARNTASASASARAAAAKARGGGGAAKEASSEQLQAPEDPHARKSGGSSRSISSAASASRRPSAPPHAPRSGSGGGSGSGAGKRPKGRLSRKNSSVAERGAGAGAEKQPGEASAAPGGFIHSVLSTLGLRGRPSGHDDGSVLHVPPLGALPNNRYGEAGSAPAAPPAAPAGPGPSAGADDTSDDEGSYADSGVAPCPLPPSEIPSPLGTRKASEGYEAQDGAASGHDSSPRAVARRSGAAWVAEWADARTSGGSAGSAGGGAAPTAADFAAWTKAQAAHAGSVELSKLTMMLEALTEQVLYLEKTSAKLKARSRECRICSRGAQSYRGPPRSAAAAFAAASTPVDGLVTYRKMPSTLPEPQPSRSSPTPAGAGRHFRTPSRDLRTVFEASATESAPIA